MTTAPTLLDHEFYVYDLNLNLLGGNGHGNLIDRLRATKTFLVDTNSGPKRLATKFPQFNFVIGATHCEEIENLEGVLFKKVPPDGFPNLFVTEITAVPSPHRFPSGVAGISSGVKADPDSLEQFAQAPSGPRTDSGFFSRPVGQASEASTGGH